MCVQETAPEIDIEAPAPAPAPHGAEDDVDVREVPAPAPPEKQMNYEKNGRGELILQQVIGVGVKAFMTDRANIKPGRDGKGGVQYNKKEVWDKEIGPTQSHAGRGRTLGVPRVRQAPPPPQGGRYARVSKEGSC